MSTNTIKLLNIQFIRNKTISIDKIKDITRYEVLRHIAAKLIGEGC